MNGLDRKQVVCECDKRRQRGFAGIDLLLVMSFFMWLMTPVMVAHGSGVSALGYAAGGLTGLIVASASTWFMWKVISALADRASTSNLPDWTLLWIYLATILWGACGVWIGSAVTEVLFDSGIG